MSETISRDEVLQRVQGYLKNADTDKQIKLYPLEKEAVFRILGGFDCSKSTFGFTGERYLIHPEFVEGRFIDVIAYAVQQPDFCGLYCSLLNINQSRHGLVIKVEPSQIAKDESLDFLLLKK